MTCMPASRPPSRRRPNPAASRAAARTATVVNVHAAKTQLSRLLGRVERGERITIARAGKPVAVIGPVPPTERPRLSADDPLLKVEEYAVDGPGGYLSAAEIDRIVHGA
jgi:prevent-host-death family protein